MRPKTFIFFAITCISVVASAGLDDDILEDFSTVKGNGNYIIQLSPDTSIKSFVPKLIDGAFEIFSQSMGNDKLEVKKNKIVRRDDQTDQLHVFDAYNFGQHFKGITVKFEDINIVRDLALLFADNILKIIPDQDVEFNLPTPNNKKNNLNKRYHSRAKQASSQKRIERRGNFDPDNYEDDDFEAASVKTKTYKKKTHKKTTVKKVSYKKHKSTKKHTTTKKKTTTKKHTTTKKKTTTKKHTTTKKKATTKKHTTTYTHTTTVTKGSKTSTSSSAVPTKNVVSSADYAKQSNAEWNLIRISQHKRNLAQPYIYDAKAGSDVYVYVIDDGMNIGHVEFEGRATWGWSAYEGASQLGEGHGTHVAGIIGGKTYGVAKKTNLIAVQVLNESGRGSISSLLSGLQWVTTHAKEHRGKAVINMSLGMKTAGVTDSALSALNKAIDAVVDSGVPLFAAAGNWGTVDACDVLPAGNKNVYTVGATDKYDAMTDFSSYGKCVQILAPGDNILSSYIESKTSTIRMSGTSMASPHAAGVAALLIGQMDDATPAKVYNEVTTLATKGVISSISHNTVNRLLFNGQKLTNA